MGRVTVKQGLKRESGWEMTDKGMTEHEQKERKDVLNIYSALRSLNS